MERLFRNPPQQALVPLRKIRGRDDRDFGGSTRGDPVREAAQVLEVFIIWFQHDLTIAVRSWPGAAAFTSANILRPCIRALHSCLPEFNSKFNFNRHEECKEDHHARSAEERPHDRP